MNIRELLNRINTVIMACEDTKKENPKRQRQFDAVEAIAYKEIKDAFGEFKKSLDQDTNIL